MHVRRRYLLQPARIIYTYVHIIYMCRVWWVQRVRVYTGRYGNILYNNSSRMRVVSLTSGDSDSCEHLRKHAADIYIMSAYRLYILVQRPRGRRLQESCPFWIDQKKHLLYGPYLNNIGVWPQSDLLIRILHIYIYNNIWCIIVSPTINALWWRFSHVFGIRCLWFTPPPVPPNLN